jgi:hypothetical protein
MCTHTAPVLAFMTCEMRPLLSKNCPEKGLGRENEALQGHTHALPRATMLSAFPNSCSHLHVVPADTNISSSTCYPRIVRWHTQTPAEITSMISQVRNGTPRTVTTNYKVQHLRHPLCHTILIFVFALIMLVNSVTSKGTQQ